MGRLDDAAPVPLSEDPLQTEKGHNSGLENVSKELAGPDGGQLVGVSDEQHRGVAGHGLQQMVAQHDVQHRGLVDHHGIGVQGPLGVPAVTALPWLELQQTVQRLGLPASSLAETLGRPPGGGRQCHPLAESIENRYHGAQYGRLAGPGPARQDKDLLRHGFVDRLPLFPGQLHSHPAAGPVHGGRSVEPAPLPRAGHQHLDGIGHGPLGKVEAPEEDSLSVQHDPSRLLQAFYRCRQQLLGEVETALAHLDQFGIGNEDVALACLLQQQVLQGGLGPVGRMLVYPHLPDDLVGGYETDPPHVLGQPGRDSPERPSPRPVRRSCRCGWSRRR